jgi:hypothetical protein
MRKNSAIADLDGPENIRDRSHNDSISLPRQKAIWIASYPKSGNTWVRVFLHNLMRELRGETQAQSINELSEWTLREGMVRSFQHHLGKPAHEASLAEIAAVRALVQADMVRGHEAPLFVKTHNAVANIEGHPTINFDVTLAAIYVVRNPLDVAVSYAHYSALPVDDIIAVMAGSKGGIPGGHHRVYEYLGSWSFHVASWMSVPHRPVLTLRYEDMLMAPERCFGRLARFLGLKPDATQLQHAIEKSSFQKLARQEAEHGFVERPECAKRFFRSGRAGQWRDVLSPEQVRAVLGTHAPMMMRFGYVREGLCAPWKGHANKGDIGDVSATELPTAELSGRWQQL